MVGNAPTISTIWNVRDRLNQIVRVTTYAVPLDRIRSFARLPLKAGERRAIVFCRFLTRRKMRQIPDCVFDGHPIGFGVCNLDALEVTAGPMADEDNPAAKLRNTIVSCPQNMKADRVSQLLEERGDVTLPTHVSQPEDILNHKPRRLQQTYDPAKLVHEEISLIVTAPLSHCRKALAGGASYYPVRPVVEFFRQPCWRHIPYVLIDYDMPGEVQPMGRDRVAPMLDGQKLVPASFGQAQS